MINFKKDVERMPTTIIANLAWKDGVKNLNGYSLPKEILKEAIDENNTKYGEFIPLVLPTAKYKKRGELLSHEILCYISSIDLEKGTCLVHCYSDSFAYVFNLIDNFIGLNYKAELKDEVVTEIEEIESAMIVDKSENCYIKENKKTFIPETYLVIRPKDEVKVMIVKKKKEEKYVFVNITKGHLCPCEFNSPEEALADMDNYIKEGKIIKYVRID